MHAGGINALSGEPLVQNTGTLLRRSTALAGKQSILQDYIIAGCQYWLDGVAKLDGKVMQFVAGSLDSDYFVESQITAKDSVMGLQFEVAPTKERYIGVKVKYEHSNYFTR